MISIRLPDNIAVAVTEMAEAFVFEEKALLNKIEDSVQARGVYLPEFVQKKPLMKGETDYLFNLQDQELGRLCPGRRLVSNSLIWSRNLVNKWDLPFIAPPLTICLLEHGHIRVRQSNYIS
jgi:hypothetical protein